MAVQQQWFASIPELENFGLAMDSDTEAYTGHLGKARVLTKRLWTLPLRQTGGREPLSGGKMRRCAKQPSVTMRKLCRRRLLVRWRFLVGYPNKWQEAARRSFCCRLPR